MLCVDISAKQGMLIFWLDKHLVYGLLQIVTVLSPAQSIRQCISDRVLGVPPRSAWPPALGLCPGCPAADWCSGVPQHILMGSPHNYLSIGRSTTSIPHGEPWGCFCHKLRMGFAFSGTWKHHLSGSLPEKINPVGNTHNIQFYPKCLEMWQCCAQLLAGSNEERRVRQDSCAHCCTAGQFVVKEHGVRRPEDTHHW